MKGLLSELIKHSIAITTANGASGTADITGAVLDMAGYDAVEAIVMLGPVSNSAVTTVKWQQGAAADLSDATDLEGSSITIAGTDDNKAKILDLYRPSKRYVRLYIDRDGTNAATIGGAMYLQYGGGRSVTVDEQGTDVAGEAKLSPAEGTA